MERYTFEVFEKDEESDLSFFDVKVIKADSFGEAQRKFNKKYGGINNFGDVHSSNS